MNIVKRNHNSIPIIYNEKLIIGNYFFEEKKLIFKINGETIIKITDSLIESQEILLKKILITDKYSFVLTSSDFEEYLFINNSLIQLGVGTINFVLIESSVYVAYSEEGIFSEYEPSVSGIVEYDIEKKYFSTFLPEEFTTQIIDIECINTIPNSNRLFFIVVFENYEQHLIIYDKKNSNIENIKLQDIESSIIDIYCNENYYFFFTLNYILILDKMGNKIKSLNLNKYFPSKIINIIISGKDILFESEAEYYFEEVNKFIDLL